MEISEGVNNWRDWYISRIKPVYFCFYIVFDQNLKRYKDTIKNYVCSDQDLFHQGGWCA
jgi:hypothetical protein